MGGFVKKLASFFRALARNYRLLKTSWNVQWRLFFQNSTLHGVRYIAETGRPFIEKFMWFVCVIVGAVTTMVIIVSLWEKFQTNPTITGLDTDFHSWQVPFPAITICQSIPSNLSNIEQQLSGNGTSKDELNFYLSLTQLSFDTVPDFRTYTNRTYLAENVNLKRFVFALMNRCEDIFDVCEWKSYRYKCCDGFFPVFTENGFCYSFNSRHYEKKIPGQESVLPDFKMQYIKETDIKWSLKFSIRKENGDIKMPIYIHNSDEVPGLDMQPQHVWDYKVDRISFSVKQTYTTEDARQLTIKQRHCIFENEVKLKIDHMYTYTACNSQCRMETSKKRCGCVPHFYPEGNGFKHCTTKELACIADHLEEIRTTDRCSCELGCSNTVYEVEKLNENGGETYEMEAEFVSWPMVRYKREVLFGWVDLLVSFGGIAGLFLGFSLLSGVEVLYYFTMRACCMVYKERNELRKMNKEERMKPLPDYDLSLVPYFVRAPRKGKGVKEVLKRLYREEKKNKIFVLPKEEFIAPFGIEFMN